MRRFQQSWRLVAVVALSIVLWGSLQYGKSPSRKRPILIVGTDYAPPYYSQNADGQVVGVAVDVLTRAASRLDFDLRFIHLSGKPDILLRSHAVDLWPVLTITKERSREFHMTEPWLLNTFCLIKKNVAPLPEGADLRLAHWSHIANTQNAHQFFPHAAFVARDSRQEVMRAVCLGLADAGLIETRVLESLLLHRPKDCESADLAKQSIEGGAFPMGIAAVKGAGKQAEALHREITRMASSGELAVIFERWSSITANEANAIMAMNAAQHRSRFAFVSLASLLIVCFAFVWQFRRLQNAFQMARREVQERKRAEEARRMADQTRDMVLQGAGEGICGLDAQGMTVFLNTTASLLLGLEGMSMQGHDFHALVHGKALGGCGEISCSLNASLPRLNELRADTGEFCRYDGSHFPVEFISSPLFEDGAYTGSVITFKDISGRRQAELLDHDRNGVLEMLAENQQLDQIFEAIANLVERQCPSMYCATMVTSGAVLELRAAPSLPRSMTANLNRVEIGPSSISCGVAAYWSKPVISTNLEADLLWESRRSIVKESGIACCWSYPILSASSEVLGTVALYGKTVGGPQFNDQVLLQIACRLARLAVEQSRLAEKLKYQANHDSLTGLPNRPLFEERLRQSLAMARQTQALCAVFYIDLDRFKQINDTLSHHVGDLYLCQVAKRLEQALPLAATLARLGGDEFGVVLPFLLSAAEAEQSASKLLTAMQIPFTLEGYTLFGTASVGIALSSDLESAGEAEIPALLQSCADQAMYRAKSLGRNRYQFYSADMSRRAIAQLEIERSLRDAIEGNKFLLHYQPQCRSSGELVGFEALIRLWHPERGLVPPSEFIPIAEESGLIVPIGHWVLRESCRQVAVWRSSGFPDITVAINVSAAQLSSGSFADDVAAALKEHFLDPSALEIELTESMIMGNFDEALAQMTRLRDLGVKLSIDDFGTGYSSLSYLHRLPVHTIKIDQSFVRAMDAAVSTRPLVEAIVAAARSLRCNVIAEGVETEMQRRELAHMGCDHMQGYFFSRPLPAADALKQYRAMALAS